MAKITAKHLRDRWVSLTKEVDNPLQQLKQVTKSFSLSPFGTILGMNDFRGLPLVSNAGATSLNEKIAGLTFSNHDFSHATISQTHFDGCHFENCKFDQSSWLDTYFWNKCSFESCSFSDTTFNQVAFNSNEFRKCVFIDTKWKGRLNSFVDVNILNCKFVGDIKSFDFRSAVFSNTVFEGSLHDVTFRGWVSKKQPHPRFSSTENGGVWLETPIEMVSNKMEGVDFSKANLTMTNLADYCYLTKVILPNRQSHCAFVRSEKTFQSILRAIESQYENQNSVKEKLVTVINTSYKPHPSLPHAICHIDDHVNYLPPGVWRECFHLIVSVTDKCGTRL
jgi:uncharacterized protein YjbI with pentapeptide repeats